MSRRDAVGRREALRLLGAGALGALSGCNGGGSSGPRRVRMVGLRFEPARASVPVGGTVEWTNDSEVRHTVTAYGDRLPAGAAYFASGGYESERAARNDLDGGLVEPGGTYRHTFGTAGQHPYFCIPHEGSGMTGVVVVG